MRLKARIDKLRRVVAGRPPPGQLDLVVCLPAGCGMADDQPPGVHFNVDGKVAAVVYAGSEPDPAVVEPLSARLGPWGMLITSHPGDIPPPPDEELGTGGSRRC